MEGSRRNDVWTSETGHLPFIAEGDCAGTVLEVASDQLRRVETDVGVEQAFGDGLLRLGR